MSIKKNYTPYSHILIALAILAGLALAALPAGARALEGKQEPAAGPYRPVRALWRSLVARGRCAAGLAGQPSGRSVCPDMIGRPQLQQLDAGWSLPCRGFTGSQALTRAAAT